MLAPIFALACADPATAPDATLLDPTVSAALSATLPSVSERPFNSKAGSSRDSKGSEGWKTTEYKSSHMLIVNDGSAPRSASSVAEVTFRKGLAGGEEPLRATADFDVQARTVTVDLWNKLSSNWQGPTKAASVLFTLNVSGSKRIAVEAQGAGSGRLTPAVSLWSAPDSRDELRPNVVSTAEVTRGQWQHWRLTVRMNTVGRADGLVEIELDGVTVLRYADVAIVDSSGQDYFNQFDWKPRWGGSGDVVAADMTMRWDHVALRASTSRVADGGTSPVVTPVASVVATPGADTAAVGSTQQFKATALDAAGNPISGAPMTWKSVDSTIATISTSGLATARKAGVVLLVASSGTVADTARLTVTTTASSIVAPTSGFFVSTSGRSSNSGSSTSPWDLATAFAGAGGKIGPGDTVWVRGGDYRGTFSSTLTGTASAPIVIRAFPGERAAIVSNSLTTIPLVVRGEYTWYWGLEVYNENPTRYQSSGERPNCVYPNRPNNKFINLVLHDCQVGMSLVNGSQGSELYGTIIYNNGWVSPSRTHGHGIYVKNDGSRRTVVRENIVFNQMRVGLQLYTDAGSGQLKGVEVEGNVFFNNGVLTGTKTSAVAILLGGNEIVDDVNVRENFTYYSPGLDMRSVRIGYNNSLVNGRLSFERNYLVGNATLAEISDFNQLTFTGNKLIGAGDMVKLTDNTRSGYTWFGNTQHRDVSESAWLYGSSRYTFAGWKSATGLAAGDAVAGRPGATEVFVRRNEYEEGRANIIVYNWGRQGSVAASLAGILNVGDAFEIRNVQNFWGTPAVSGTYSGGTVMVPMTAVQPPRPIGDVPNAPVSTGSDFGVFVVVRK